MALTKQARDALPASDFAVPGKRALPMHDAKHARMAWDMVSRTGDLSDEERAEARRRILRRSKELGVDTSDWNKIAAMRLEAMAIELPTVDDHPNRMPFSGVLVHLGRASDNAPHGTAGRRIILTHAAAEAALPSLLGMAVDFTPAFDGHNAQSKIGIITAANIEGDAVHIEGFIYASDFPDASARIRADKDAMGFSFEAENVAVADPGADPLEISSCVFTGAAILQKHKAAYTSTSLAASAAGDLEMSDEIKKLLEGFAAKLDTVSAAVDEMKKAKVEAATSASNIVEPHAKVLETAATNMEVAGIGAHTTGGHVHHLRQMAADLRAQAALGQVPHVYGQMNRYYSAAADTTGEGKNKIDASAITDAVKPFKDEIAALSTKIADLQAAAAKASPAPERKTVPPMVTALLAKVGLSAPEGDDKMDLNALNKALDGTTFTTLQRLELKAALTHAGKL